MEIDLTNEPDIDIEPGVADTPVPALGYKLFDMEELDVDYLEITGPCAVLPYMNKGTFNLGTTVRNHGNMLLVAQGSGYVYVEKDFKNPIIVQLSLHFGITMEPSDDDRGWCPLCDLRRLRDEG
ncbi:hypothetical protein L915_18111 [Phytophthora nicotianae]|uniref:Uncharacterized protein n=1 Tax=Phytophthora nicotianae TaxID=4792 RepID=W2FYY1_PHYNI|nr:hypothetical protein L915_18111 [Phytophthora nicotianae]